MALNTRRSLIESNVKSRTSRRCDEITARQRAACSSALGAGLEDEPAWLRTTPRRHSRQADLPAARSAPDGPNDMDERLSSHQKMDEQRETPGLLLAAAGPVRFGQRLDREPS